MCFFSFGLQCRSELVHSAKEKTGGMKAALKTQQISRKKGGGGRRREQRKRREIAQAFVH